MTLLLKVLDRIGLSYFNPFDPATTPEPSGPEEPDIYGQLMKAERTRIKRLLTGLVLLTLSAAHAQTAESPDPYAGETSDQRQARLAWFREARFGLFIHWGVYAVPAGIYDGKAINGGGEWIMNKGRIPVAEYRKLAAQFNPVKYDPDAWVQLARRAGMKYLVITAKHHDGFALFDSAVTDWDVVDATPYGKDLLKPLAEACRTNGIRLGFYYSQAQDWTHPGGAAIGGHWDPAQDGSMDDYISQVAVPQVRELLSGYGEVAVLWWDTPANMNPVRAGQLLPLLRLQPGIIHNNRLGGGFKGDTDTPEQRIPSAGMARREWETCMTLNDTWGFKSDDRNWKSAQTIIRNLVDIASKGGNYLLNVGPTAEGEIPAASVERLEAVGQWMAVNSRAIHGTTASPFSLLPWGRCTLKQRPGGTTLFLHVFDWPADGILHVPGLRSRPREVRLLATGAPLDEWRKDGSLEIGLPLDAPDARCSVLAVEIDGALDVEAVTLRPDAEGKILLPAEMAELNSPGPGSQIRLEQKRGDRSSIGFWSDPRAWVKWVFKVTRPGVFDVVAEISNPAADSRFRIQVGKQTITATVGTTGSRTKFKEEKIGRIKLDQPGQYELSMRPELQGWNPLNLCEVTLTPVK